MNGVSIYTSCYIHEIDLKNVSIKEEGNHLLMSIRPADGQGFYRLEAPKEWFRKLAEAIQTELQEEELMRILFPNRKLREVAPCTTDTTVTPEISVAV